MAAAWQQQQQQPGARVVRCTAHVHLSLARDVVVCDVCGCVWVGVVWCGVAAHQVLVLAIVQPQLRRLCANAACIIGHSCVACVACVARRWRTGWVGWGQPARGACRVTVSEVYTRGFGICGAWAQQM
jgi:hypothetical protein